MAAAENLWYGLPLKLRSGKAELVPPEATLSDAAAKMEAEKATAVLIGTRFSVRGIVTDKDLRKAIAANPHAGADSVENWMSSPLHTFKKDIRLSAAQIAMLRHDISHLVLTEDGTAESAVTGMLEQRDILIAQGHNPALLMRKIKKAADLEELGYSMDELDALVADYLDSEIPIQHLAAVKATLTDALISRLISRRLPDYPKMGQHPFTWISLGSLAREEQLLPTDQDNALVFKDGSAATTEALKRDFLELAEGVNRDLKRLGFDYCPAGIMAQNPEWCMPLEQWKAQFSNWIRESGEDDLMKSCIFFDFRAAFGEPALLTELRTHIRAELQPASLFKSYMAVNALKAPPATGIFGRLIREGCGPRRGLFDLKARGMMPLADMARILCLDHGHMHPAGTPERFAWLEEKEPQNASIYRRCRAAYLNFMRIRARSGLKNTDSGRYLNPAELDRIEAEELKTGLKAIRPLKSLLEVRFRVSGLL